MNGTKGPPSEVVHVLVVDDEPRNLVAVEAVLSSLNVQVVTASSGREALLSILHGDFAVVVLDLHMPEMDGLEVARVIREAERTRHLPIVFLTANDDLERAQSAYAQGAVDYLLKPIVAEVLRAKVSVFVDLQRQRRRLVELERTRYEAELLTSRLEHEQKTAAALADANQQLQAALAETRQALAAREEFLRVASHELKTPLTSMQLTVGNILRRCDGNRPAAPEAMLRALRLVDRQTVRLNRLSEEMLTAVMIEAGRLRLAHVQLDLADLVRETAEEADELLEQAGCTLTLDAPAPVIVDGDAFWLAQVVRNLLANAAKFAPGQPVEVRVWADERQAYLSVRDHGPGVPEADRDRIFQRFERAVPADNYGGLGLGLYVVQQVIQAHEGAVLVSDHPDGGARFCLSLPRPVPGE